MHLKNSHSFIVAPRNDLEVKLAFLMALSVVNIFILALKNEFSEIIYISFGGRQNICSTLFATTFVVICAAILLKIG